MEDGLGVLESCKTKTAEDERLEMLQWEFFIFRVFHKDTIAKFLRLVADISNEERNDESIMKL